MRVLVTGASELIGSNLALAAAQQSWKALGTWSETPVRLAGVRASRLDVSDRQACVALAEEFEPDVLVHAAASAEPTRLEREPGLARLAALGTEHTLAAARAVRARYVLVSTDWVFGGQRSVGQSWSEHDPTEPVNAYGRARLAAELAVASYAGGWLITRPASVYGVNLAVPLAPHGGAQAPARHVWERSGSALRWVAHLRAGRPLPAPAEIRASPTYAWDYAQRVCELIAQECEGVFNTAGPDSLGLRDQLLLLARAFGCDGDLVRAGDARAFLRACGADVGLRLPANTTLSDARATFVLGRPAVDPLAGYRLMREQLRRVLGRGDAARGAPRELDAANGAVVSAG